MPEVVDEGSFVDWSTSDTCGLITPKTRFWYETTRNNVFASVLDNPFLGQLNRTLEEAASSFRHTHNVELFAFNRAPTTLVWDKKTYVSFLNKLYRINCIENPNFPSPPTDGWCALQDSFRQIDDTVRTTVVVAYADGPAFLARFIEQKAGESGLRVRLKDHAKEKGYYAHHVYVYLPLHVSAPPSGSTAADDDYPSIEVPIEIQITTELQGALREITHRLYEKERNDDNFGPHWKSQFGSGRFKAAYMAHSLRFIEAMIVELRSNSLE